MCAMGSLANLTDPGTLELRLLYVWSFACSTHAFMRFHWVISFPSTFQNILVGTLANLTRIKWLPKMKIV